MKRISLVLMFLVLGFSSPVKAETFTLPPLPYAHDALSPFIDEETMQIHHGKHHQAYINNLNAEIERNKELQGKTLEDIVTNISAYNTAVRNNAGGHWNHTFFWQIMTSPQKSSAPSLALMEAIEKDFGTLDNFKTAFEKAGLSQFGSGWVWLVVKEDKSLAITTSPNQDNPLMDIAPVKGMPILGNDVWEHAYYITYQNRRGDYLNSWWSVVNWNKVSELYAQAIQ